MASIAAYSVTVQTSAQSLPSTPCWFGEVVLLSRYPSKQGVIHDLSEQVRFARRRFGRYEGAT